MPVRVAINGFGRIGRTMFRAAREQGADIEWVAINDIDVAGGSSRCCCATTPSTGASRAPSRRSTDAIRVDGTIIPVFSERDPAALPWGELDVDVVDRVDRQVPRPRRRRASTSRPARAR